MIEFEMGSEADTALTDDIGFVEEGDSILLVSTLAGSTSKRELCATVAVTMLLSEGVFNCCSLFSCIISGKVLAQPSELPTDIDASR